MFGVQQGIRQGGKPYKMNDLILILFMVLAVALGAVADGFNERGQTNWGHPVEALEKIVLLLGGLYSGSWLIVISYTAFRMSIFDIIKNLAKKQEWFYLGDSNAWDRFLSKYPVWGVTFARVIVLAFAIGFTIKEF